MVGVALSVDPEPDLVGQVLTNLIDDADRHTPSNTMSTTTGRRGGGPRFVFTMPRAGSNGTRG